MMSDQADVRKSKLGHQHVSRRRFLGGLGVAATLPVGAALLSGCSIGGSGDKGNGNAGVGLSDLAQKLIAERKLSPDDVTAALKTYMPSGQLDDYVMFASSGHAGQIFVIGLPSMRVLKTIAVYTPEP